jgi:hypothetical protein
VRPLVEVGGEVFIVVGWEHAMPVRERHEIRRLTEDDLTRYRGLQRESDVELFENFVTGTRPAES